MKPILGKFRSELKTVSRQMLNMRFIFVFICITGAAMMVVKHYRCPVVRNIQPVDTQIVKHLLRPAEAQNTSQFAKEEDTNKTHGASCHCPNPSSAPRHKKPPVLEQSPRNTVQSRRRTTMLEGCKQLGINYTGTLHESKIKPHMIYDQKSNLVFCDIPKVGSTFLKQVLHIVAGHHHEKDPFKMDGTAVHKTPFTTFNAIPYDQALKRLVHSVKFLFVRDPFSRMLSGYVDKLYTNNYIFWGVTGKKIVNTHRANASKLSLECGHDITFPEFIKHVIRSETSGKNRDPHWYPMYDACRPCSLEYDVIGKIETFKEDLKDFLTSQKLQHVVDISNMDQGNDNVAVTVTVNRAFEAVRERPKCILLPHALVRAWKVLQIRGVLSQLSEFPYDLIKKNPKITQARFLDIVVKEMKQKPLSQSEKLLSRQQAMIHAYSSVSSADLEKFTSVYHPDFSIFGYKKDIGEKDKRFLTWEPFKLQF
ncbi:carbohydrate sulfotransferase 10-like [Mizuhopecten yessoensis]|uniref:Carbohydrate sulfotransferase n=1 Tax=Mizuhopecten yessoensis TaxID=6573 RepID=A0A210QGG5_MIZYE|nr:carbohydrate sulfotransferase 10-like [Mizuhopecten yessoensis]OWF47828.1 Carbohydrate sulfotransferase 11 [Mizuhopecten yessoensis]